MIDSKVKKLLNFKKKGVIFFLLLGIAGLGGMWYFLFLSSPLEESLIIYPFDFPPSPPPLRLISGQIQRGQTLSSALKSQNLSALEIETICQHLKKFTDLRRIKPGDSYKIELTAEGKFIRFSLATSPVDVFQVSMDSAGKWASQRVEVPIEKYWTLVSGEITSNLFTAMNDLQEGDQLVLDFADIFAAEIDFHSDPQPKDRFRLLVEKYYSGNTFIKYGRILYASYQSKKNTYQAIYFAPRGLKGDYYTPQGESVHKAFLKSPLKFTRISSHYTSRRHHPILGGVRPHYGVDYAAPVGTPVWAVADGIVTFCGWNQGFGKQVIIKHSRGYKSMYGHLSRFAPGIRKGKIVRQKQIIGYVGATGLATGPHLDFRLIKNNVFRNPLKEISPRAASLPKDQLPLFQKFRDCLEQWLAKGEKYRLVDSFTSWEKEHRDAGCHSKGN